MMTKLFLFIVLLPMSALAQVQLPGIEVNGGYRFDYDLENSDGGHGWFFSAAHGLDDVFSLALEVSGSYSNQEPGFQTNTIPGLPAIPPRPPRWSRICPSPNAAPPACDIFLLDPGHPGSPGTPDETIQVRIPGGAMTNHAVLAGPRLSYSYASGATPFFQPLIGVCDRRVGDVSEQDFCAQLGAGANFWTGDNAGIYVGGQYRWTDKMDWFGFGVGVTWKND